VIRPAGALLLAVIASTIAAGCSGGGGGGDELPDPLAAAGSATPRRGGTLHLGITDDMRTLDPAIAYDEFSSMAEHLVFDQLVGYARGTAEKPLEIVPMLAESWTISPDGTVYTFTLRPGLVYHDGSRIEPDDFVFAIERLRDPATGSPGAQFFAGVKTVRALDERRLEITLSEADPSFLMIAAMYFGTPYKRSWAAQQGDRLRERPLASGPFVISEWQQGSRMVFERNPRYWNAAAIHLDRIEILLQLDRDVTVLKFLRGELDAVERLSSDKYVRFARSPKWQPYIHRNPGMNAYGELMDCTRPPFDDKRVRQAMNYALSKEDTVRLYNGRAVVSHGIYPPNLPGYDPTLAPYPHDPEKARALLAEAGYPDGFEVVYTTTKDELAEKVAQSIQSDLAQVGVRVKIRLLTFPAYLTAVGRHELQFAFSAWYMDFPDPWNFIEVKFHSRYVTDVNSSNDTGFRNAELDALLDAARRELDPDERIAMYQRAERILHDEAPWIWHYHAQIVEITQPYVRGYEYHPVYLRDYRYAWLDRP
jgi:ABC-type transport system substrate-binding protein